MNPISARFIPVLDIEEYDLLRYAAVAENKQTHPISLAIRQEADHRRLDVPPIGDAKIELGYGLKVQTSAGP